MFTVLSARFVRSDPVSFFSFLSIFPALVRNIIRYFSFEHNVLLIECIVTINIIETRDSVSVEIS
jgi:hypothetical protein